MQISPHKLSAKHDAGLSWTYKHAVENSCPHKHSSTAAKQVASRANTGSSMNVRVWEEDFGHGLLVGDGESQWLTEIQWLVNELFNHLQNECCPASANKRSFCIKMILSYSCFLYKSDIVWLYRFCVTLKISLKLIRQTGCLSYLYSPLVLEGLCGRDSSSLLWIWKKKN